jgi:hypothetical protein
MTAPLTGGCGSGPPTEAASKSQAYFEPLVSLPRSYSQASFWPHRCHFKQAGHSDRNLRSDSELNLIFSVVRPVGTILPKFGHRIKISGIPYYLQASQSIHGNARPKSWSVH